MKMKPVNNFVGRRVFLVGVMGVVALLLLARGLHLQVLDNDRLRDEGDARYLRVVEIPAHRGMIVDRNGEPLAISTPVDSIWANPQKLAQARTRWAELAQVLNINVKELERRVKRVDREFVYLRRHVNPALGKKIAELDVPGVYLKREYRRYYPAGEVTGHLVGFTNVDDIGQEGMELAYDKSLQGQAGAKRVILDRHRQIVENVESIKEPAPGRNLVLSIDRRIQYLAYRELLATMKLNKAQTGLAVIVDVKTGEVLAAVNQPAFNPNARTKVQSSFYRNRVVTDVFEPGSTVKPLVVAAALEAGKFTPHTMVDTAPGFFRVGGITVRDIHNYGLIDVSTVIQKSSNVGVTKIAMSMTPERLWSIYDRLGFGELTGSGFPGEQHGVLRDYRHWRASERATMAFGYGLSSTALQLARAYAALGNDGVLPPLSFERLSAAPQGQQVMTKETALQVRTMMELVTADGGTATTARVPGYRIAGKTGTVHKISGNGYAKDKYLALFAGLAPASKPRLAMVVMINEPTSKEYYGGLVAAPVFARTMAGALRLLNVTPDDPSSLTMRMAKAPESADVPEADTMAVQERDL